MRHCSRFLREWWPLHHVTVKLLWLSELDFRQDTDWHITGAVRHFLLGTFEQACGGKFVRTFLYVDVNCCSIYRTRTGRRCNMRADIGSTDFTASVRCHGLPNIGQPPFSVIARFFLNASFLCGFHLHRKARNIINEILLLAFRSAFLVWPQG